MLHLVATLFLLACVSCTSESDRPASSNSHAVTNAAVEPATQTMEPDESPIALPRNEEVVQKSDLIGKRFRSSQTREVGLGEDGVVGGHWYLLFEEQRVRWDFSDVRESGSYTVDASGSLIVNLGSFGGGTSVEAYFHKSTGRLLWNGLWYDSLPDDDGSE